MKKRNKIVTAVIGATVVAVGSSFLLTACDKDKNKFTPGPETGFYYYETDDGETYYVALNSDGSISVQIDGASYLGNYTVRDGNVSLSFGDEKSASGVYSDNLFTLTYNDESMLFKRVVDYTVSYDSAGGSDVGTVTVMNGKSPARPQDPARDDYAFIGWYLDENYTVSFEFGVTPVTEDIRLYARWSDKLNGAAEYVADFDLNYAGSTIVYEPEKTIGGKLYNVPVPAREGYTFAGWWVSDYEQSDKLTYLYDGGVLDANTTLYALWQENDSNKLATPTPRVDGDTVVWDAVDGASAYSVEVISSKGATVISRSVGATSIAVPFSELDEGECIIKVTATSPIVAKNSETAVRHYNNKGLSRVSVFSVVEPSVLLFNAVDGAEKYTVSVVCGNPAHNHQNFDCGTSTYFNFASCPLDPEFGISFTVTASAKGKASSVSKTFHYNRLLDKIDNLYFDADTETVRWTPVANAADYEVNITAGDTDYRFTTDGKTNVSLKGYVAPEIKVSVTPKTAGYNSPESADYTFKRTGLYAPQGLKVTGNKLSWTKVDGAASYTVYIDGQSYSGVKGEEYNLSDLVLTNNKDYEIKVKAVGGSESVWSDSVKVQYYSLSDAIVYAGNTVTWRQVIGATNYAVKVNDEEPVSVAAGVNSLKIRLTKKGVNTISVRYTDDGGSLSDWQSVSVYAYEITFDSRQGEGVSSGYYAIGDAVALPEINRKGYDLNGWYNVPGAAAANGQRFDSGSKFTTVGDMILYANWSSKPYTVTYETAEGESVAVKTATVEYQSDYRLAVPTNADTSKTFVGWVDANGKQLTDSEGYSLAPWSGENTTVRASWVSLFNFTLQQEGAYKDTYAVVVTPEASRVSKIIVPSTYNGKRVTIIEGYAFNRQSTLKTIEIPDSIQVVYYNEGAFEGCTSLEEVNVYSTGLTRRPVFSSDNGILYFNNDVAQEGKELVFVPAAKTGHYVIPDGVQSIGRSAFSDTRVTSLTIPSSVSNIAPRAFYGNKYLAEIAFGFDEGDKLVIGESAFDGCTALKSLTIPARFTDFDPAIFGNGSVLENIFVADDHEVYSDNNGLLCNKAGDTVVYCPRSRRGAMTIPAGVRTIGEGAFGGCTKLTSITIPGFVTSIGKNAFDGCSKVTAVTFGGGSSLAAALTLNDGVFANCTNLNKIEFANNSNVVSIGKECFKNCNKITTITLPKTIGNITPAAFSGCGNLVNVKVDAANPNYADEDGVLFDKKKTEILFYSVNRTATQYIIPATVEKIGESVFGGNVALERIVIGNKIRSIETRAFNNCVNLKSVVFVDGAANGEFNIGNYAFADCRSLTGLYLAPDAEATDAQCTLGTPATLRKIGNYAFNGTAFKNLVFSEGLTETGSYTFGGKSGSSASVPLETVSFPATLEVLGESAFFNCENLRSVTFASGSKLKTIKREAFYSCDSLTSLVIPASVTMLEAYSLSGAALTDGLVFEGAAEGRTEKITISVGSLPYSLTVLRLPEGLVDFPYDDSKGWLETPIDRCSNLQVIEGMPQTDKYTYKDGVFYANDKDGNPVTLDHAILANTRIVVPKTVTYIMDYSLGQCSGSTVEFEPGGTEDLVVEASAFNNSRIVSVAFPARLKSLGAGVFEYSSLQSVTFEDTDENPSRLEAIPDNAFANMTNGKISEVIIPRNVKSIGEKAFEPSRRGSSAITRIVLNEGLESIGEYAFANDSGNGPDSITELVIPSTVKFIGDGAFGNASNLKTITFAQGENGSQIEIIGASAFRGAAITEITLPKSLAGSAYIKDDAGNNVPNGELGAYMFVGCLKLGTVTFEDGCPLITSYGNAVFSGCTSYVNISFPVNLGKIGVWSYGSGGSIKSITIPKAFDEAAFMGFVPSLGGVTDFKLEAGNENLYQDGEFGAIYNKDKTKLLYYPGCYTQKTYTVLSTTKTIVANAFFENQYLEEVILPEGLEEIGDYAFGVSDIARTTALAKITVPSTVKVIGEGAFYGCTRLGEVTFAKNEAGGTALERIGTIAFRHCSSLKEIDLPDTITTLGDEGTGWWSWDPDQSSSVFYDCALLETVTLPNSLGDLQSHVFGKCPNLKEVIFKEGNNMTRIGSYAFAESGIQKIDISKATSLGLIEEYAFYNCNRLSEFTFNTSAAIILGQYVFANTAIEEITLPANVTEIGDYAFYNIPALTSLTLAEGSRLERIGDYAFGNAKIASFDFGKSSKLAEIGDYAFANTALTEIILPDTVIRVGKYSFYNCASVEEIKLSKSLEDIGDYAFAGAAITSLEVFGTSAGTAIGKSAFANCSDLETIALGEGIDSIGSFAFAFTKVTSVVLPETILSLEGNPFAGCALTSFEIKSSAADILYDAAKNQILNNDKTLLYYTTPETAGAYVVDDKITSILPGAFAGSKITSITIPDTFEIIEEGTFKGCTELTSITIGKNVTEIRDSAFEGCTKLETLVFEAGGLNPLSIGAKAFKDCTALGDVVFPHRLRDRIEIQIVHREIDFGGGNIIKYDQEYKYGTSGIAESAFENSGIKSVSFATLPEDSELNISGYDSLYLCIGVRAFAECKRLTSVELPQFILECSYTDPDDYYEEYKSSIEYNIIGDYAFYNCSALATFEMPEHTGSFSKYDNDWDDPSSTLGEYAFAGCTSLTAFDVPRYLRNFSAHCFAGAGLTDIVLPRYIREDRYEGTIVLTYWIGDYAFAECPELVSFESHGELGTVSHPQRPELGAYAFRNCVKLQTVVFDDMFAMFEGTFDGCIALETATIHFTHRNVVSDIPDTIGAKAFNGCSNLTTVVITGDLTTIGEYAFAGCTQVGEFIIPEKVVTVASTAFMNWTREQTVKVSFADEAALPGGYNVGWSGGATVEYGYVAPDGTTDGGTTVG